MTTGHICVILAKGHSIRLPNKNKILFDGQSLTRRAIDCAKAVGLFDRIVLDTDDEAIRYECSDIEVHWREEYVRGDDVPSAEVVFSIPGVENSRTITLLQVTSPLRTPEDVAECLRMLSNDTMSESVVSVVRVKNANRILRMGGYLSPISTDEQPCCVTNGAIWCVKTAVFLRRRSFITEKTLYYEMPKTRSVDIDTKDDFMHALALWEKGYGKN